MIKCIRGRLTFANVMSMTAVFLALGGSAYAFKLGKNTVGAKQIKKGAVTRSKLGPRAVGAGSIATGSIGASKLGIVDTYRASTPLPDNSDHEAIASCPDGETLIGGGANSGYPSPGISILSSRPSRASGDKPSDGQPFSRWSVEGVNPRGGEVGDTIITAWAVCLR